jgi:hypothetical protein
LEELVIDLNDTRKTGGLINTERNYIPYGAVG